jgi:hypothetical protein
MQSVRFFEDRNGPGGARRLLVGVASSEEDWAGDGGRREAVKIATTEDAETYPLAYAAYQEAFTTTAAVEPGTVSGG